MDLWFFKCVSVCYFFFCVFTYDTPFLSQKSSILLYPKHTHTPKKKGYVLQGETYNRVQIVASLSMTLGIVLTVFANTKKKKAHDSEDLIEVNPGDLFVSVSMMLCAMLLRSLGNVVQQRTYKMYGKHVTEVMFYQHALVCQQQSHRAHSSHSSYEKTLK